MFRKIIGKKPAAPAKVKAPRPKKISTKARFYGERDGVVSGAVFCPDDPSTCFHVEWVEDKGGENPEIIATAVANLKNVCCDNIPQGHGFEFKLPVAWIDGQPHRFEFRIRENGRLFPQKKNFYQHFIPDENETSNTPFNAEVTFKKVMERIPCLHSKSELSAHIVVVTHNTTRTGAPIIALNLIKHLTKNCIQRVTCVSLSPRGELAAEFEEVSNIFIQPANDQSETLHNFADDFCDFLKAAQLHAPTYVIVNSLCSHPIASSLKRSKAPSMWLFHEFPHMFNESAYSAAMDTAGQLVVPCSLIKQAYSKVGTECLAPDIIKKIEDARIVPQGVVWKSSDAELPSERDPAIRNEIRKQWGVSPDAFVILSVGTVDVRKGADWFVHFAQRYLRHHPNENIKFIWVGEICSTQFAKHLQLDIECIGAEDHIRFVGPSSEMEAVYAGADVMLMCSRLDPFPNVVMEAMRNDLPVIGFDKGQGTSEIIGGKNPGVVVSYLDTDETEEAINLYLNDRELLKQHGVNASKIIHEQFHHERFGDDIVRAIFHQIGRNHGVTQLLNSASITSANLLPDKIQTPSEDKADLLVILGHMKSGTNWLCNVVNHRPEVCIRGEYHWGYDKWQSQKDFDLPLNAPVPPLEERARECMRLSAVGGTRWYGDRSPVSMESLIFPNAHLLYIYRDPRDIIVSNAFHHLNNKIAKQQYLASRPDSRINELSEKHRNNPTYLQKYPDELFADQVWVDHMIQMIHRQMASDIEALENHPDKSRLLKVRYETLHSDFEAETKRIFTFLDLDSNKIDRFDIGTVPGFGGASNNRSFFRKGQPGDWMNYFHQEEARILWDKLSFLLVWGNYVKDDSWIKELPTRSS